MGSSCIDHHALRTERWRYIRYVDGSEELYDHGNDPHEWKNLAVTDHEMLEPLRARLEKILSKRIRLREILGSVIFPNSDENDVIRRRFFAFFRAIVVGAGVFLVMADFSQSNNSEERFVQLFARNERHLRAFVRSMGLDWGAVDDVMQTVSLVMWRKWNEFAPENGQKVDSDFLKWGRVIARFEVLKFRRKMARDRHVFDEDLMERLADAAEEAETDSRRENYQVALAECLKSLPAKSRNLIGMAYAGDQTIRELAEEIGKSATALYKSLDRIRKSLHHCIQTRIESMERRTS